MSAHTSATGTSAYHFDWHKPEGRGRKFRRAARGLARRLRLPFVQDILWERDHPEALIGKSMPTYGPPWNSTSNLADFSFACTCHKRARYSRKATVRPSTPVL